MSKRMGRVKDATEISLSDSAQSAAKVYEIAIAAAMKRDPQDVEFNRHVWELTVEGLAALDEGEFTVKQLGEKVRAIYQKASGIPVGQEPKLDLKQELAWQAVACHIYVLLNLDEEDPSLDQLEYRWAEWVEDRVKGKNHDDESDYAAG